MPEMVSQTFQIGALLHLPIIDPTCGRYCLKALLKYLYEKNNGVRLQDITLPRPASGMKDWMGYDPYDDFQFADLLLETSHAKPATPAAWTDKLRQCGPIILQGTGIGHARYVGHYILLVGMTDGPTAQFHYKDPLVGDAIQVDDHATLDPKIEVPLIHAAANSGAKLAERLELRSTSIMDLPFRV
jgi:hypothetical protein